MDRDIAAVEFKEASEVVGNIAVVELRGASELYLGSAPDELREASELDGISRGAAVEFRAPVEFREAS